MDGYIYIPCEKQVPNNDLNAKGTFVQVLTDLIKDLIQIKRQNHHS